MSRSNPTRYVAFALMVLGGCAASHRGPSPTASPSPQAAGTAPGDAPEVFGSINGVVIRREEVQVHVGEELREVVNELEQRRLHLYWVGLEEAVAERLLVAEARQQGLEVKELVEQHVAAKVVEPTDEEVRAYYDENQALIEVPYDVAAAQLREQMLRDRQLTARRQLVDALRGEADVRYALPIPSLPRFPVEPGNAPARGPADAAITLVAFSDFECAYCARARHTLDRLVELYPDSLRVVFRDFPLAQHPRAQQAAEAAQCAHEQGKFWRYHDLLFDNAHGMDDDALRRYAGEAELAADAFEACVASERPKAAVAENIRAARRLSVRGTPAIFLNGIKLIGLLPLPIMQAVIDQEIASRKAAGRSAP